MVGSGRERSTPQQERAFSIPVLNASFPSLSCGGLTVRAIYQHCPGTDIHAWRSDGIGTATVQGANGMGNMLYYAIVFLVVALVAAFLGFGGVAGTAMEGARLLFWVAIVLFVVSLIAGIIRKA
jgi:uncharacterized membrane protein YtjA (UPF0391 family)